MKKTVQQISRVAALSIAAVSAFCQSADAQATDLFLSEYVEGSSFNKYVEIYNGTGSAVNLADYELRLFINGSSTPGATVNLGSGTVVSLNNCAAFVVGNSTGTIYTEDLVSNTVCNFNGDDALGLFKISTGTYVDIFGQIGCDPGTQWTGGANITQNQSLRRLCAVSGGVTANPAGPCSASSFPTLSSQWSTAAIDDASNLGVHDCPALCGPAPCSSGLFFSQYTEGASFNKCVEIANYTGAAVNLTGYTIRAYHNGSPTVSFTVTLSGTVADGDVFVVCNPSANAALLAVTDLTSSSLQHNGDDALVLVDGSGNTLDIIGQIGCDPGSAWSAGGNSTIDNTLFRNPSVTSGITVNPAGPCGGTSFTTLSTEWFSGPQDIAAGFGSHNISCSSDVAPNPSLGADVVLCSGSSVTLDAGAGSSYLWSNGATTPTITVSASGTYAVTVTNSAGSGSDAVTVIVKEDVILALSGDNSLCAGESTSLSAAVTASDLFISEYVEGSSNNKCIEIANLTGASVDLSAGGYSIEISFNGGTSVVNIPLAGTVAAGDVHVLCSNLASGAFLALADQTTTTSLWNGDDAISLKKGTQTLDIFGRIGSDPGAQWGNPLTPENNTADRTLQRNCSVYSGVNANPSNGGADGFVTLQTEWTEFAQDDASGLGSHSGCAAILWSTSETTSTISVTPAASASYSVTIIHDNGCTASGAINVTVSNPLVVAAADDTICAGDNSMLCADVNSRDLFFSEYVEGTSLNKCIEIFNNTGATVDLAASGYSLEVVFNGGTFTASIALTGTVADGDAYVLCDDGALGTFLAVADQVTTSSLWNGNDALVLRKGTAAVDIFGVINSDPGTAWISGANSTLDATLRRASSVSEGVSVNPLGTGSGAFATLSAEWVAYPVNDASGLGSHTFTPSGSFAWSNGDSGPCAGVSPAATTTYTVTYTDANGCTSSDEVTVVVNPAPVVDAGDCYTVYIGYGSACATLTADASSGTAPYAYLWSNGATTATISVCPGATTVYTVTVTDANGCSANDNVTVNVIDATCKGGKVEVCHVPPGNPAGAHTLCIAAPAVAAHLAHGDYIGACGETDPCTSAKTNGTEPAAASENMSSVFPNPFSDHATLSFTLTHSGYTTVRLYDVNGSFIKTIFEGETEGGMRYETEINSGDLAAGIYYYEISSASARLMDKMVVVK